MIWDLSGRHEFMGEIILNIFPRAVIMVMSETLSGTSFPLTLKTGTSFLCFIRLFVLRDAMYISKMYIKRLYAATTC